ncbi:MAG: hypothetical protein L6Q57_04170 [Alphaproteobacteria bacterium]|nr:hypothetical protein [Alphaproteobacteria bacterium]
MPHIIVEHSAHLNVDIPDLLTRLHNTLAEQPTVDKARIKTRALPVALAVVGKDHTADMMHITLKVMPREPALRKVMAEALRDAAKSLIPAECPITVEVQQLDADSYCA